MGHSRQSSRRLGERRRRSDLRPGRRAGRSARAGRTAEAGWKPKRTIILLRVGRRRARPAWLDRMGREHADELRQHAVAYINSDTNGRGYLCIGVRTRSRNSSTMWRRHQGSRDEDSVWKRLQLPRIATRTSRRSRGSPQTRRSAHRRARLRLRLHRVPAITSASQRSIWASVGKMAAASITRSTTISTGTRISAIPISSTAGAGADRRHDGMRLADADLLPFDFTNFADTMHRYIEGAESARDESGRDALSVTARLKRASSPRRPIRQQPRRASGRNGSDLFKFRAARQRRRQTRAQRNRVPQSLRTRDANGNAALASAPSPK